MKNLFIADLTLFDGAASGAGAGAGTAASGEGNAPADAAQGNTEGKDVTVVYGKQPQAEPEAEPAAQNEEKKPLSPEEKKKAYSRFVNSADFKDVHTEEVQRVINKRFKETKALEEKVARQQRVIDAVAKRYNVSGENADAVLGALEGDTHFYERAAEEAGMTVEQYAGFEKLRENNERMKAELEKRAERDQINAQVKQWMTEADAVKQRYPDFDLDSLLAREEPDKMTQFERLLKAGLDMEYAYRVLNMDRLMAEANKQTAELTEKAVVDSVRAKGARPAENGAVPRSAFVVKDDVNKLTKEDRAEIAKKVMRGESISF